MPGIFEYSRAELPEARAFAANGALPARLNTSLQKRRFRKKWQGFQEQGNDVFVQGKLVVFREDLDQFIAAHWSDPTKSGSFMGRDRYFKTLQQTYTGVPKAAVADFLKAQPGHQRHLQQNKPVVVNPVQANAPYDVIQIDQTEFRKKFLLCAIDLYSKYCWVSLHQDRATAADTVALLTRIEADRLNLRYLWKVCQTDNGTEFINKPVQDWLEHNQIKSIQSLPYKSTSQGAIERFHRTLKVNIGKRITVLGGRITQAAVDEAVRSYNNSWHSATGMVPAVMMNQRKRRKKGRLVRAAPDRIRPLVKKGDYVRLSIYVDKQNRKAPPKADVPQWSEEIYKVVRKSKNRNPLSQHLYTLENRNHVRIGAYYRYHLQKTDKHGNVIAAAADDDDDEGPVEIDEEPAVPKVEPKPEPVPEPKVEPDPVRPPPRAPGPGGGQKQLNKEMRDLLDVSHRPKNAASPPVHSKRKVIPTAKVRENLEMQPASRRKK